MTNWIYCFGDGTADGSADMKNLLGGKGANLAEMSHLGLPVPPGFTITTEVCTYYYANQQTYPKQLKEGVAAALALVEKRVGAKFADPDNPLLVSVRSGARASMPGMMDTVLNLGLNDKTVVGLAKKSGDERFAYDSYRRFIQMYAQVVLGIDHHHFEDVIERQKLATGKNLDTELTAKDWQQVVAAYKSLVQRELKQPFPQDPQAQLWGAIGAVFGSWMNQRAITYRRLHDIPADWGTAVNVQAMVFGNMGDGLRHRRRLHAQPLDRRQRVLWRVPGQCAGRGCRRRHPHAAASDLAGKRGKRRRTAGDGRGDAGGVRASCSRCARRSKRITATCRTSNSRCSRAGSICCRPAPASAPRRRR